MTQRRDTQLEYSKQSTLKISVPLDLVVSVVLVSSDDQTFLPPFL